VVRKNSSVINKIQKAQGFAAVSHYCPYENSIALKKHAQPRVAESWRF
jgi:hypothetical protein